MVRIQTNVNALYAALYLEQHNRYLAQSLERLSSGYRINRAADDPGGLAIAEKLRARIRGFQESSRGIGVATSFVRTAEDGMSNVVNYLFDIRDLALEATNSTVTTSERLANQSEIDQLVKEIDRLTTAVKFNGLRLLNGAYASQKPIFTLPGNSTYYGSAVFHVGPDKGDRFATTISTLSTVALKINTISVTTQLGASNTVALVTSAIARVLSRRARLGGVERRLQLAQNFADLQSTTLLSAESSIRDADIAQETIDFTRRQILVQAASAMLAQANLLPRTVLNLLLNLGGSGA